MSHITHQELLQAGVHLGHLTRRWNPRMAPYLVGQRDGIHLIDLSKTLAQLEDACAALEELARLGKKVLFVSTKKQSKHLVEKTAQALDMPYVSERWLGGTLTNFITIKKSVKKMTSMEKTMRDASFQALAKREQLSRTREKAKLEKLLCGLTPLTRLPAALFVVDVQREHIAVSEARSLGIPVFAIVDTNADPSLVDYPIVGNDDSLRAVRLIIEQVSLAVDKGLRSRKEDKEAVADTTQEDSVQAAPLDSATEDSEEPSKPASERIRKPRMRTTEQTSKAPSRAKSTSAASKSTR